MKLSLVRLSCSSYTETWNCAGVVNKRPLAPVLAIMVCFLPTAFYTSKFILPLAPSLPAVQADRARTLMPTVAVRAYCGVEPGSLARSHAPHSCSVEAQSRPSTPVKAQHSCSVVRPMCAGDLRRESYRESAQFKNDQTVPPIPLALRGLSGEFRSEWPT